MKYIAVIAYNASEALSIQLDYLGSFDDESSAKEAVENYIEGTLEIVRAGYENLVVRIIPSE